MEMFDMVEIQQYTMQEDCPGPTLDLGIKKGNFIKLRAHNINNKYIDLDKDMHFILGNF